MYNNVEIRNGFYGVLHYDKDGNETYFEEKGKAIILDSIRQSIENDNVKWRVYFDYIGGRKQYDIERDTIADKKLIGDLQHKGADVTLKNFNAFVDSMRLQEHQMSTVVRTFKNLGWMKIPVDGEMHLVYRCSKLVGNIKAEYDGNLALKPKGSLNEWVSMIKKEVLGRPQLETILLAALSAPIVGIYGITTTTDNPIFHINFSSGKGKSTVCYLATSVSGEPFDGKRVQYNKGNVLEEKGSLYGSWGATPKATISAHAGNRGVVAVLNELGKFGGSDMTQVVFALSEGSDIKRLNTQLQSVLSEGFNSVFISCGEMSLIDRCKSKLEGIKTRVMEISVPMTESAEHSRNIKKCCVDNNGYAAPMIAKYIIDNGGADMIEKMYSEVLRELTDTAPQGISDRYIEKFPTFLVMAARLAKVVLDLDFDIDSVVSFCYECVEKSNEEDGDICKSFDEIIETLNINEANFYNSKSSDHKPKVVWGRITYPQRVDNNRELVKEYCIYPNKLKELLNERGFPNPSTELKIWRDKGVLDCDKNHLTKKIRLKFDDKADVRMYVIQLWREVKPKKERKLSQPSLLQESADDEMEVEIDGDVDSEGDS